MKIFWHGILIMMSAALLLAQDSAPAQVEAADKIPTFRSDTALVKVDIQVADRNGRNIGDLERSDFVVLDENQPQRISDFGKESEPLHLVLLLDVSGSMTPLLSQLAVTTREALSHLRPGDQVALMFFTHRSELGEPFTTDFSAIARRMVNSIYKSNLGTGTLINEAVVSAADYLKTSPPNGRRAILIVTDNKSARQGVSDAAAIRAIHDANAVLNAIVVGDSDDPITPARYQPPDSGLPDVFVYAKRTGGDAVRANKVEQVFRNMIDKMRTRYNAEYVMPASEPGAFRRIRVELSPAAKQRHPDAILQARDGYYVPR